MSVNVQPLTAGLFEVRRLTRRVLLETSPPSVSRILIRQQTALLGLHRSLQSRTWFEARDFNRLTGVASVSLLDPVTAYLSDHMVLTRGQGVGRALTEARLDWAKSQGARVVKATTHPWCEASIHNLTEFGFAVVDIARVARSGPIVDLELRIPPLR
jgi:RimJ/RimL family protein N-acetyltransferase